MSGGREAVRNATAVVFVNGRRAGSAVLVGRSHLVTAAHVLPKNDGDTKLAVAFPGDGERQRRVTVALRNADVDVAVLEVQVDGDDVDAAAVGLPDPVLVWAAGRLPQQVAVFGYPLSDSTVAGVWRRFEVAGPTAGGAVQLRWEEGVGTFRGHSGGPVVDSRTGAWVGVLIQGSEDGRFDRFVPHTTIAEHWPDLPWPWLYAGADAKAHFLRRALGQRSKARGGDQFHGRTAAVEATREWLTTPEPPGVPLVITGQPGAGKSSVLARAVHELDHHGPGLAFHARDAAHQDLLTAIADFTGAKDPTDRDDLIDELFDTNPPRPWMVAVDALDEAASQVDREQMAATLVELAQIPGLRVAVATRPLAVNDQQRFARTSLLYQLGARHPDSTNLVDLDADRFFDPHDLATFAATLLTQERTERPGPPGHAWQTYRDHPDLCARLSRVIAHRAGRNYLVAAMAADALSTDPDILDPTAEGFDPALVPSRIGEALHKKPCTNT